MSQIGRVIFGGSDNGPQLATTITADTGSAQAISNTINALGGSNMNTEGVFNSVTVNLDNIITIDGATIGDINLVTNTISSLDDNDIILDPNGTGDVVYNFSGAQTNSAFYFDSDQKLKSEPLTDGQLLIGRTGSTPVAGNIIAGTNATVTNSANNVTIASTKSGAGGLQWTCIDASDYPNNTDTTITMARNNGYVVKWWGPADVYFTPEQPAKLNLQFPSVDTLTIGDMFIVMVLSGLDSAVRDDLKAPPTPVDINRANVRILPGVDYGIQAIYIKNGDLYVDNLNNPLAIVPYLASVWNGSFATGFPDGTTPYSYCPTITFLYVGNENNVSGSNREILQVSGTNAIWQFGQLTS